MNIRIVEQAIGSVIKGIDPALHVTVAESPGGVTVYLAWADRYPEAVEVHLPLAAMAAANRGTFGQYVRAKVTEALREYDKGEA